MRARSRRAASTDSWSTEMRSIKNSAGLVRGGQRWPRLQKWARAASVGPRKATRPPGARRSTSSRSCQIEERGWCSVATAGRWRSTARSRMRRTTRPAWYASRPVVGSSAIRACGSPSSSQASASRRRSPPEMPWWERSPTRESRTSQRPRVRRSSSTRAASSSAPVVGCTAGCEVGCGMGCGAGCSAVASCSVSRTVSSPKKESSCERSATLPPDSRAEVPASQPLKRLRRSAGTPSTIAPRAVVLPAPEGPSTPRSLPARTLPLQGCSTTLGPTETESCSQWRSSCLCMGSCTPA
eukprot:scaffold24900_cov57-Phaeocystis_antarctica.AAC.3